MALSLWDPMRWTEPMFVQYFGLVARPFADVSHDLLTMSNGLPASASVAYRNGEALMATLTGPARFAKTVTLEMGEPIQRADSTAVPLSWWATGTPGMFPTMEAELSVAAMGPDLTQVTFQGTYKPPLGIVGHVLDRTLLHRFAESSVKDFVDRVISDLDQGGTEVRGSLV
jgi:hypothetical protein